MSDWLIILGIALCGVVLLGVVGWVGLFLLEKQPEDWDD